MELNLKTQQNKLISLFRVSLMFFLFFFVQQTVASSQSITLPSHNITIKDAFSEGNYIPVCTGTKLPLFLISFYYSHF